SRLGIAWDQVGVDGPCPWRRIGHGLNLPWLSAGWAHPGSAGAEAALGSARALLSSAPGTARLSLPSHYSDSFASDKPVSSTVLELS
ncbi:hypothetical protein HGM15179_019540, partial [Zosterops borbonicus]